MDKKKKSDGRKGKMVPLRGDFFNTSQNGAPNATNGLHDLTSELSNKELESVLGGAVTCFTTITGSHSSQSDDGRKIDESSSSGEVVVAPPSIAPELISVNELEGETKEKRGARSDEARRYGKQKALLAVVTLPLVF